MGGNQVSGLYTLHMRPLFSSTSNKVRYVPWSAAEKILRWEVADTRTWSNTGFSEKSCSCSNSLISFLILVITFPYHWKINAMTIYSRSCNFLYIFFCLVKTSSYKATVTSNYAICLEQKNIFTWQESHPQEIFLIYQHGHHFVLCMAAVKSGENDL